MGESASYARRGYSGSAANTTLDGGINASATTIPCNDLSTWSGITTNGPGRATITDGVNEEEVEFTGISGDQFTGCTRGVGGTTAQTWAGGETVKHTSSYRDFDEANLVANQVLGAMSGNGSELYRVNASGTGVETVPPTSAVITDFAEAVQDTVGAMATDGTTINFTYNDGAGTLTAEVQALTSANISDFAEVVRDTMGTALVAGTGVTITPSDPGDTITVASISTGLVVAAAAKSADGTPVNNSTTLVADADLTLAVAANSVYLVRARLYVTSNTTADVKFQFDGPASATGDFDFMGVNLPSNLAIALGSPTNIVNCEATDVFQVTGVIRTGATAGNLALSMAQNTATAVNTILKKNSWLETTKVS